MLKNGNEKQSLKMLSKTEFDAVKYLNLFCASLHGNWSVLIYNKEHGYDSDVTKVPFGQKHLLQC
ncbi:hypothetical protein PM8797T_06537 [Gimesia maris DSM 8797]|uniref:Uncharacterized protein n=1 Tax=Gimesia maris TaxID=122 RepID=A0ABX5YG42_9PLAN|nr:hypothetical protein PM8797T_06537 [Gimesia maris DSM 8797]QDU12754.1 hypothetical protein CA11_05340 [Gimesia maris]QEG14687.1 hypothetical protein GmarT_05230 [Gimesia maris]